MDDFQSKARPHLEALLEPDEELRGIAAASQQQSVFKGRMVALAATDRRLIMLPLNRRIEPEGAPLLLSPQDIYDARAGDAWYEDPSIGSVRLKLQTTGGQKLKLQMMRGGGKLAGGEGQREGVEAIAAWFRAV